MNKTQISQDEVLEILMSHNRLNTDKNKVKETWIPSKLFSLMPIPTACVFPATPVNPNNKFHSNDPIIVDKNIQETGRFLGNYGTPPECIIIDGKHRHAQAIKHKSKIILAYVGTEIQNYITQKSTAFCEKEKTIQKATQEYISSPNGSTLRALQQLLPLIDTRTNLSNPLGLPKVYWVLNI